MGSSGSPLTDVESVMRAVLAHAGGDALDDDTTIASVQWGARPDEGERRIDPDGPTVN